MITRSARGDRVTVRCAHGSRVSGATSPATLTPCDPDTLVPPGCSCTRSTREEAARRAPDALVVLPVGATEQHGPHLPLGTDFLIVEHVTRAAAQEARASIDVLVAPTFQTGSSHHHLPFGGTISLSTERYYGALRDMTESLIQSGFRRIFIVNGHGGNHELIELVVRDLALSHACNLAAASYWDLAREPLAEHAA